MLDTLGGVYCEDCDVAGLALEEGITKGIRPYAIDEANAKRLWTLSETMIGITFNTAE
jgi:hypothetical protein